MRRIRRFAALFMAVCIIASSVPIISAAQMENTGNGMDDASLRTSVEASGTGSVGRMLADAISEEQSALQASESLGYAITSLTVTGSQIDVSCRSDKAACVMVALYAESGELVSFGSADIEPGERTVTVSVLSDIPESFTASAFMIDPETRTPLCAKYTTTLYTKAMRELSDASIDDYDANLVLNLDDDSDNNFAVFNESVHVIPYQSHVNEITDNGNGSYTVADANEDITSLRTGDIFAALSDNGDALIIQVGQIHVNGSTVLITQTDRELEIADVFQVVKIEGGCLLDENGEIPEEARVASLMDTGVETKFLDKKPFQWEKEFKGEPGGMNVTVGLEGTVNATAKVKLYFMSEEQYFEAKVSFSSEFKASISGSSGRLTIPLLPEIVSFSPVPGLYISLNPSIVLEASVKMEFSAKATASVGFAYLGGANFENRSENPKIENVSLKAEGKFYIGFSLEPKIKIAGKVQLLKWELEIAEASITAEFGVTFSVSMEHDFLNKEHVCLQCLKGTAKVSLELFAQAKLAKYFSPKVTLYKGDLETIDCYYSVDYDEFGFGKCPHKQYLVTVLVKLPSGSPGGNLTVKASGNNALYGTINKESVTNTQGKAEIYLPDGTYALTCETADYGAKGETAITVDGKKADAAIQLSVNVHTVTFNANGGAVTTGNMTVASGQTLSSPPTATRDGYTFAGWNTAADGSGNAFTVNSPVTENITVYAQWKAIGLTWSFDETTGTLTIAGNGPMKNYEYGLKLRRSKN